MPVESSDTQAISLKEVQDFITTWIKDHPYDTLVHIFNGVAFFHPALLTLPALTILGVKVGGPVSAKAFAVIKDLVDHIEGEDVLAIARSISMGVEGSTVVEGAAQIGTFASSALFAHLMRMKKRRDGPKL